MCQILKDLVIFLARKEAIDLKMRIADKRRASLWDEQFFMM